MSFKKFLRTVSQRLNLYESMGIAAARLKGIASGIRIIRNPAGDYRLSDRRGRTLVIGKRHAIYLMDMVSCFDFFFGAVVPDAQNEVHYEKPGWHTIPGRELPLFFTSYAESAETLQLYSLLAPVRPGDVVLDIGAYCGLSSLHFAEQVTASGRVYAFEADPGNFAALETNRQASGLKNITVEHAAVWKESGTLEFQADGTAGSRVLSVSSRSDSMVRVRSVSLPDYVTAQGIERIDLIKIDVEGAEAEILASSRSVLRRYRPALIVELHPVHDVMTTVPCVSLLEEEGYQTSIVSQPGTDCPLLVAVLKAKA